MPLNRNAPRESMPETYDAMRLVTYAKYDGITLDDYEDLGDEEPVTDGGTTREYDSPHEKLRQEFDILMGQNNTILRKTPAYTIGQLFQLVDAFRRKHGLEIEEVREEENGVYLLMVTGGEVDEVAAAVGLDDPEQIADLDVAMVDDRKLGGGR